MPKEKVHVYGPDHIYQKQLLRIEKSGNLILIFRIRIKIETHLPLPLPLQTRPKHTTTAARPSTYALEPKLATDDAAEP